MAEKRRYELSCSDGSTYSVQYQSSVGWGGKLKCLHSLERLSCLCRPASPVLLVIRNYGTHYGLARHPGTGPDHQTTCFYYGPAVTRGWISGTYVPGVIEDNGCYKVSLCVGRKTTESSAGVTDVEAPPTQANGAQRQGKVTALGLLKLLWEIAGLHELHPDWVRRRTAPASVSGVLLNAAAEIRWGGAPLSDYLQVGSAPSDGNLKKLNEAVAARARENTSRMVIVARLRANEPGRHELKADGRIPLAGWGCTSIFLSSSQLKGLERSFERELNAWRTELAATYALLIVEPKTTGTNFRLVQIALMRVSERAIPLDSGYEAMIEQALVDERRHFDKPMRFAPDEQTLPDFRLLDLPSGPMPMEVFGRTDLGYQERMNQKVLFYCQSGAPWWHWEAYRDAAWPDFP
ncbi:DUF1173 family protein [Stenotrophomonas sp. NA06056]|uniref:DUF1173 family protein n=1 Tax=Stenotrophomonas sp. NA06056 TaxID=2742129 RepID=UPI00158C577E|nr:DUF1173 family protein [Stenotrophomonas sp. NA06056]QKW56724.1 DUF1173 family protein [Stenotrophomonas sp. NA06056]